MQQSQHEQAFQTANQPFNINPPSPIVHIDTQLLQVKKQLLAHFYTKPNDEQRIIILKQWPNPDIQLILQTTDVLLKANNGWYTGASCNDMFHGQGLLIYRMGAAVNGIVILEGQGIQLGRFYEGYFQNNCKHGYGFQYISGDVYVGNFINNKPEDKNGVFMWKNGDLFIGEFVNGMKHGFGRWESQDDFYEGTWKLNRPEGSGKISTVSSQYEGDVKNGFKHGRGIEIFSNGDQYQGLYANGKPQGDGNYSWKNGAVYKGQFKNGIRYGFGFWAFGSESYQGNYVNDKRNGEGIYKWGSDSQYKGHFLDDLRHGLGEMHWGDGSIYKGQWREGAQCGQGETWEEGVLVSKGTYQDGRLIREPNRLQSQKVTVQSSKTHQKSRSKEVLQMKKIKSNLGGKVGGSMNSTRYPEIQPKQRNRIFSQNVKGPQKQWYLNKIDQFPRVKHDKKHAVSSSFSSQKACGQPNKNTSFSKSKEGGMLTNRQLQQSEVNVIVQPFKVQNAGRQKKVPSFSLKKSAKMSQKWSTQIQKVQGLQLQPIKWKNFNQLPTNTDRYHPNQAHF